MNTDDADAPDIPATVPRRLVWTTAGVPDSQRLEYWTEAVSSALFEMGMSTPVRENFQSFVESAPLDALTVTALGGTRREAIRAKEYIGLSNNYSLHVLVDFTKPWILRWRGAAIGIAAGQIVLTDTRYVHSGIYPEDSATGRINIKLPPQWIGKWLRQPDRMVGCPIPRESGWGMALSAFVAQMSPKLAMAPPLPARLIADQLGGLLSLVESELFPESAPTGESQLVHKIVDLIRQRSNEMSLLAKDVADPLGVSERTLHRHLQAGGKTFSNVLQESRIDAARQMLESPHLRLLTTAEIGVRCGFGDPSHFTRVMRARLGQSPGAYRKSFIGGGARPFPG